MKYCDQVNLYESNVVVVKDYKIKRKVTLHKSLRKKGFEVENRKAKGEVNAYKLDENIWRAKAKIFELAYCNPWELFITLTLDPSLYDRFNIKKWHKELTQWILNYNKKYDTKIKYLLIPERHKDGAWHIHGLLMGLPKDHLIKNKNGYLDWEAYKKKFGYCSIDKIKNHEAVSKYLTKYISKGLADCIKEINAHMYYCSRGLERAKEIKRGTLSANNVPWDYENEHIKSKWLDLSSDLDSYIL